MAPPRSAFVASPPGGRRQQTGEAGCAVAVWPRGRLWAVVVLFTVVFGLQAAWAQSGRTPKPVIDPAKPGTQCIADPATMRREHPRMLEHQRDETVHGGIRGAKASLKACIACHASPTTGSVAAAETNFCISCHSYTAVRIDCFECHATRPAPTAFHPIVPVGPNAAATMRLATQARRLDAAGAIDPATLQAIRP